MKITMIFSVVLLSLCACLVLADVPERCSSIPDIVPCSENGSGLKLYFFNATNGLCTRASQWPTEMCVASGQDGFDDYNSCVHTCICSQPSPGSSCSEDTSKRLIPSKRWFFNQEAGVCDTFTSNGCPDWRNENRFFTESACKQQCVCTKPIDVGTGDLDVEAYAFDVETKHCNRFSYKGEGGNANRFATNEECMDKCLCGLQPQNGDGLMSCMAYIPSWVYNKTEGICKPFVYGGCGGNSNRFYTKEKCLQMCVKEEL